MLRLSIIALKANILIQCCIFVLVIYNYLDPIKRKNGIVENKIVGVKLFGNLLPCKRLSAKHSLTLDSLGLANNLPFAKAGAGGAETAACLGKTGNLIRMFHFCKHVCNKT